MSLVMIGDDLAVDPGLIIVIRKEQDGTAIVLRLNDGKIETVRTKTAIDQVKQALSVFF